MSRTFSAQGEVADLAADDTGLICVPKLMSRTIATFLFNLHGCSMFWTVSRYFEHVAVGLVYQVEETPVRVTQKLELHVEELYTQEMNTAVTTSKVCKAIKKNQLQALMDEVTALNGCFSQVRPFTVQKLAATGVDHLSSSSRTHPRIPM
jgi:hypothetical protein